MSRWSTVFGTSQIQPQTSNIEPKKVRKSWKNGHLNVFFGTCERYDIHNIWTDASFMLLSLAKWTWTFLHFWDLELVTELSRCVRGRPARLFGDSECDLKIARANKIRVLQWFLGRFPEIHPWNIDKNRPSGRYLPGARNDHWVGVIFLCRSHWVWFLVDAVGVCGVFVFQWLRRKPGRLWSSHGCVSAWVEFSNMGGPGSRWSNWRSIAGTWWDSYLEMEDCLYSTKYQDVYQGILLLLQKIWWIDILLI